MKIRKQISIVLSVLLIGTSTGLAKANIDNTQIMAQAYILMEASTGKVLRERGQNERIYPASMIKIMTAILLTEHLDLDEIFVVGSEINSVPFGSSIVGHVVGEAVTGLNMLRSIIMPSGNDTATVVAMQVALSVTGEESMSYTRAEAIFANLMNSRARELGAYNTNFVNPHGFHHPNQFTTVYDLARIAQRAMECEIIMSVASETYFRGTSAISDDPAHMIVQYWPGIWRTRNELLLSGPHFYRYATGLRTGWNDQAGYSVVATASRNGVDLIAVISNSQPVVDEQGNATPSRWNDAQQLLEYGFNNFSHYVINETEVLRDINVRADGHEIVYIRMTEDAYFVFLRNGSFERIERRVSLIPELFEQNEEGESLLLPVEEGVVIGEISFYLDGEHMFSSGIATVAAIGSNATNAVDTTSNANTPSTDSEYEQDSLLNRIISRMFSLRSVPFWLGGVALLLIVVYIKIKLSANRKWRDDYTLKRRY